MSSLTFIGLAKATEPCQAEGTAVEASPCVLAQRAGQISLAHRMI